MSGPLDAATRRRVASELVSAQAGTTGVLRVSIDGDCMAPHFRAGEQLRIERGARLLPGDVMVYRRADDSLVAHRYLGTRPSRRGFAALCKADNASEADCAVAWDRVVGRADVNVAWRSRARAIADFTAALARDLRRLSRPVGAWSKR